MAASRLSAALPRVDSLGEEPGASPPHQRGAAGRHREALILGVGERVTAQSLDITRGRNWRSGLRERGPSLCAGGTHKARAFLLREFRKEALDCGSRLHLRGAANHGRRLRSQPWGASVPI